MEGITGALFRRTHRRFFPGVDRYFMPFLSPSQHHVFTRRELRDILPEQDGDLDAVPQLLTRSGADFLWAAGELARMGYREVNLNLGCPSGTVTAKGKGAGLLGRREELERMLDGIFAAPPTAISLKTRLGMEDPEEFPALLKLFSRYPVSLLIIHPRVRQDFYRRPVRMDSFRFALDHYRGPICFNGGLLTPEDCAAFAREFPQVDRVMLGQGLLADPALVRRLRGGPAASREELRQFHDALYHTYVDLFASQRNAAFHMKELWHYLSHRFQGPEKALKAIRKASTPQAYDAGVEQMFRLPLTDWVGKDAQT